MRKINDLPDSKLVQYENMGKAEESLRALIEMSVAISKALDAVNTLMTQNAARLPDITNGIDFYDTMRRVEITLIKAALKCTAGSQAEAARLLRLKPTTLNTKIKAYNLVPKRPGLNRA